LIKRQRRKRGRFGVKFHPGQQAAIKQGARGIAPAG